MRKCAARTETRISSKNIFTAKTIKSASSRILDLLVQRGVRRTFGIPGGAISPLYDALLDLGIEHVTCQHETMAVHIAAGYARVTGTPGVVLLTSGPGILNGLTGIASACEDETPVIIFGGESAASSRGMGALQDGSQQGLDLLSMLRPITKRCERLYQVGRAVAMVQQALDAAEAFPRGPVFLQLPVDLAQELAPPTSLAVSPPSPICPDPVLCATISKALDRAKRPALLLGVGARDARIAEAALELAEWNRCPVVTDIEGKGWFAESHPLSLGIFGVGARGPAESMLGEVDLLITVGARLDDTTTSGYSRLLRPSEGLLVQLDYDPRRMARAYSPDLALCCDLVSALRRIRERCSPDAGRLLRRDAWLRALRYSEDEPAELYRPPFDPRAVIAALQRAFPHATFTSDIGNHLLAAAGGLRIDRPGGFFVSHGLGSMTSGIGAAIGMQLAYQDLGREEQQVVGICGDGGLLMAGNELATCVRYGIKVILVVFNDGQLGMVRHGNERVFKRSLDLSTPRIDISGYAGALGVEVARIEAESDLRAAAKWPQAGPRLLEVPIDPAAQYVNVREATVSFPAQKGAA